MRPSAMPAGLNELRHGSHLLDPSEQFLMIYDFKNTAVPDLMNWIVMNRAHLKEELIAYGAILVRAPELSTGADFKAVVECIFEKTEKFNHYKGGVTSRLKTGDEGVFLATMMPPEAGIAQHHEMSYLPNYPRKICFFCEVPAEYGGATPICDGRKIMKVLDKGIIQRFQQRGIMYIRNYESLPGFDRRIFLSWQDAFETNDKVQVAEYCRLNNVNFEWVNDGHLRIWNVRPALIRHPSTKKLSFFNHATIVTMNSSDGVNLPPSLRAFLPNISEELKQHFLKATPEHLPQVTAYGDTGTPIESSVLEEITAAYQENTVSFKWNKGDVLLLDNITTSHGRDPFVGKRKTLSILLDPSSPSED